MVLRHGIVVCFHSGMIVFLRNSKGGVLSSPNSATSGTATSGRGRSYCSLHCRTMICPRPVGLTPPSPWRRRRRRVNVRPSSAEALAAKAPPSPRIVTHRRTRRSPRHPRRPRRRPWRRTLSWLAPRACPPWRPWRRSPSWRARRASGGRSSSCSWTTPPPTTRAPPPRRTRWP